MTKLTSRRAFLTRSLQALTGACLASHTGMNLALAQATLNTSSQRFNDYKALVCVFLHGGNDSFNMLVPTDNNDYQNYKDIRQALAYKQEDLLKLNGTNYGMPKQMAELQQLFNNKKLAVVANTGTLVQPVTKSILKAQPSLAPTRLFSHNDQQALWQQLVPNNKHATGWAGRMADLLHDGQGMLPVNYNINKKNPWQNGFNSLPYSVGSKGPETYYALNKNYEPNSYRHEVFNKMVGEPSHLMEKHFFGIRKRTTDVNNVLRGAFEQAPEVNVNYPSNNSLAAQLAMVAKMISVQSQLGQKRQIFYVSLGGWDTHDGQNYKHPLLLASLSQALNAFNQHLEALGMGEQVTTFTQSEFGRTLTSNNDGTDHGWAGHQLVMGGAVAGGEIHGSIPQLELGSEIDYGKGRIIPSLAVEQYAAPLAGWLGLSSNEVHEVLPRLNQFDNSLNFMV